MDTALVIGKVFLLVFFSGVSYIFYLKYRDKKEEKKQKINEINNFFEKIEFYLKKREDLDLWYFGDDNPVITSKLRKYILHSESYFEFFEEDSKFIVVEYVYNERAGCKKFILNKEVIND